MSTKEYASPRSKDLPGRPTGNGFLSVPTKLKLGPKCYAVAIDGDCMAPEFRHGERVICDPDNWEITHGDTIAIWWKDHTRQPLIKRLVFGLPDQRFWVKSNGNAAFMLAAEQLNPPRQYIFSCADIESVHKVVVKAPQAAESQRENATR